MNVELADIEKIITKEIQWCEENKGSKSPEYEKGFVMGLQQAMELCREL